MLTFASADDVVALKSPLVALRSEQCCCSNVRICLVTAKGLVLVTLQN